MGNQKEYTLVTGATSGIGYELARIFAENGHNLILVARTEGDLEARASELRGKGIDVAVIAKDFFEPNAAFELYHEVRSRGLEVGILVNDAGQGVYGEFVDTDLQEQLNIIQLNVSAVTALTHLFLKDMVDRKRGKILNVASIASDLPHPLLSVYAGTKSYILSFSEALRNEVKDIGITVTALQPGPTDTDFFAKAGMENSKIVKETKLLDPAEVARIGYDALMKGDDKVVTGLKYKTQSAMSNVTPDPMLAAQMRKQLEESDEG